MRALPLAKIPRRREGIGSEAGKIWACEPVAMCRTAILAMLLKRFGKFGRIPVERSHGIDEREIYNDRQRKSVGVERTLAEDIHEWPEC
ncbi:hypothetical protein LN650_26325 [Klebsiella pneumoniae subsp. pneumoniae]|nr:hypothetical protein [Klebsiella pneumoniae subsp. pneumoniae]